MKRLRKEYAVCKFPYTTTDEEGNSKTLTDEEKAALKETAAAFLEGAKAAEDLRLMRQNKARKRRQLPLIQRVHRRPRS